MATGDGVADGEDGDAQVDRSQFSVPRELSTGGKLQTETKIGKSLTQRQQRFGEEEGAEAACLCSTLPAIEQREDKLASSKEQRKTNGPLQKAGTTTAGIRHERRTQKAET